LLICPPPLFRYAYDRYAADAVVDAYFITHRLIVFHAAHCHATPYAAAMLFDAFIAAAADARHVTPYRFLEFLRLMPPDIFITPYYYYLHY